MANYFFETMSESDASNFASDDRLFFLAGSPSSVTVTHNDATGGLHPTAESITITSGAVSHTFAVGAIATASQADPSNVIFVSAGNDALVVDSNTGTAIDLTNSDIGDSSDHSVLYAFGGNDTIDGGNHSDWIDGGAGNDVITGLNDGSDDALASKQDVLQGGAGADSITGDVGNDHIYGNTQTTTQGAADAGDSIVAGAGNDYVNGNAGADTIFGDAGNDRLYGGADADTIHGGADNDYLQGNKGADSLLGDAGNDSIHGGADNDVLAGGADNDQLWGDLGADTVAGGTGFDWLTGGAGNDVFSFAGGDATNANVSTAPTAADHGLTDVIADFADASDKIALGFTVAAVLHDTTGTVATTVEGAQAIAQGLLTAHAGGGLDVAAVTVGSDTYLFFDGDGANTTIDSVIKVLGVTDSAFNVGTNNDFA